ncbi:hypothetical protein HPP92_018879 [Vanilla planifolia]|uniref:FAS1 domain-containing protein n=1 Tax=Vanilla planifolia TaxID=51239 RepID=A0A835Q5R7_VANPL|nr:hypothetical protein HPP92_018879 [Vanilla planifolia]
MASRPPPHQHFSLSQYTPALILIFLFSAFTKTTSAVNITALLAGYPDLSDFTKLLASTSVTFELAGRSSLTLLAVPNAYLSRSGASISSAGGDVADVLRYHVLLEFLSWTDLRRIPASGKLVTTLYQTTGRATNNLGAVNLTRDPLDGSVTARSPAPFSPSNATFLFLVKSVPYNVSIFAMNALLVPDGFDLAASETRPPAAVNITQVLVDGRDFNVAASMLEASGVVEEFEHDENGAGITVFVPTDESFAELPATERLQSLPADKKSVVLRFHVLHSYYPLGSLESIVNPVQPTIATEDTGAEHFTLNITRVNGSVSIDTGIVQATITRTVYDQNPVSVFAVSKVLLPREVFGKGASPGRSSMALAAPPVEAAAPEDRTTPPTSLLTTPGLVDMRSAAEVNDGRRRLIEGSICLLGFLHLLV